MAEVRFKTEQITEHISEAKLEDLIREYRRPLMVCASRSVNRFVTEHDDEWSVTLLAFHEAVKNYNQEKGEFWPFASTVVRRRLNDHLRRSYSGAKVLPVDPAVMAADRMAEDDSGPAADGDAGVRQRLLSEARANPDWPGAYTIRDEINAAQDLLKPFGFSFYDLTKCSPKAGRSRQKCSEVLAVLLSSPEMMEQLYQKHMLPAGELTAQSGISGKVIDKHRRYLIAAALILDGDFPLLAEYLKPVREAVKKYESGRS